MEEHQINDILGKAGFRHTHNTKKLIEYTLPRSGITIYLKREVGLPNRAEFVVNPNLFHCTSFIPSDAKISTDFYHNSNMKAFPKRRHTGETEIHFGKTIEFNNLKSVQTFASHLSGDVDPSKEYYKTKTEQQLTHIPATTSQNKSHQTIKAALLFVAFIITVLALLN